VQAVKGAITPDHPYFHPLASLQAEVVRIENEIAAAGRSEKAALKAQLIAAKAQFDGSRKTLIDAIKARQKQVARAVKELSKLKLERDESETAIARAADSEILHLRETARDLTSICSDQTASERYFRIVGRDELSSNEFNLNLPRYIKTYSPETPIDLNTALLSMNKTRDATVASIERIKRALKKMEVANDHA